MITYFKYNNFIYFSSGAQDQKIKISVETRRVASNINDYKSYHGYLNTS